MNQSITIKRVLFFCAVILLMAEKSFAQEKLRQSACQYENNIGGTLAKVSDETSGWFLVTERSFYTYQENLDFDESWAQSMQGKKVLDVGGGLSDFTDIMTEFFAAQALSIDISYTPDINLGDLSDACKELFWQRHQYMDARQMSFANESYDWVLSNRVLMYFFDSHNESFVKEGVKILDEMIRVTTVGGQISIGGYLKNPYDENKNLPVYKKIMSAYLDEMQDKGVIEIEAYSTPDSPAILKKLKKYDRTSE